MSEAIRPIDRPTECPTRPTCLTCPFWAESLLDGEEPPTGDPPLERFGVCRRHAPRPEMVRMLREESFEDFPVWPQAMGNEWCGEHPGFAAYLQARAQFEPAEARVTA